MYASGLPESGYKQGVSKGMKMNIDSNNIDKSSNLIS